MSTSMTAASSVAAAPSRRRPQTDPRLIWAIAGVAGVAAAFAGAEPTGIVVADVIWSALLAVVVTLAASRARRWSWLWLSGIATAAGIGSVWATAGAVALALSLVGAFLDRRNRLLGATIGALAGQTLLRLPELGFHGLPTLLCALAVAPVLWSAYDRSLARDQRRIRRGLWVATIVLGLLLVGLAVSVLAARISLERGADGARDGLELVRQGDPEQAGGRFATAAVAFAEAGDALGAPWAQPGRLLPVVGPQLDALLGVSRSGEDLTSTAAEAARTGRYQDLRAAEGQIDLELVRSMQEPVARSADALRRAGTEVEQLSSSWLLPPVADQLDRFAGEIADALPEAELASTGLAVAPALLGGEGTRAYLLLFTSPAETRFLGGFAGSYGVLTAQNGRVELTESGPISELAYVEGAESRTLVGFDEVLTRYGRYNPTLFFQNLTVSPDFPTDAAMAAALYPQATGQDIDGVLVADPYALGALLELTGPITVEGLDQPLNADNAADYLLREQYLQFDDDERDERRDRLSVAARATFEALTERDLPGPRTAGDALGSVVRQKRLLFWTFDRDEQEFLDQLGTSGRFAPDRVSDYLSVRTANANPSKIDTYLRRELDYEVEHDPETGRLDSELTIRLFNDAPSSGLPWYVIGNDRGERPGTNTMYLSLYSPLRVGSVTVDGQPVGIEPQTEAGSPVYSLLVSVPPEGSATVTVTLDGFVAPVAEYRLALSSQPLVNDDVFRMRLAVPPGWEGAPGADPQPAGDFWREWALTTDETVSVPLRRS
jgi:hypothetical protein